MKTLLITTVCLITSLTLFSQTDAIEFTYDAAGNRTERHVIELKAPENPKAQNPKTKNQKLQKSEEILYEERLGDMDISIFPNPTKGELTVSIRRTAANKADAQESGLTDNKIEVFTIAGETVLRKKNIGNKTKIDLSKLPNGMYVLKIFAGERISTWKIVKE